MAVCTYELLNYYLNYKDEQIYRKQKCVTYSIITVSTMSGFIKQYIYRVILLSNTHYLKKY